jgi:hypothetical protein
MSSANTLQPADLDPSRSQLAALELEVAARERELSVLKGELQQLQTRYLNEIGALYSELARLETDVREEEIRAGLRPAISMDEIGEDAESVDSGARSATESECSNRGAFDGLRAGEPSVDLKKMFREVARAIHPDLAMNDPARWRRHSLMAEANRAYAERDEDRLRLIMRVWERSPEAVIGDDPEAEAQRVSRRIAILGDRLVELDAEFADVRDSAIGRLKRRIDDTLEQGWDLFAEMLRSVERDIARARARLATLKRRKKS